MIRLRLAVLLQVSKGTCVCTTSAMYTDLFVLSVLFFFLLVYLLVCFFNRKLSEIWRFVFLNTAILGEPLFVCFRA